MTTLALFLMLQAPAPAAEPPAAEAVHHELLQVKNVYILPMGNGFDQFLANALTRKSVLQVVADPAKADAIFTDRLGKGFELKLAELYPEPKPEEAAKAEPDKEKDAAGEGKTPAFDLKNAQADRVSSFGRGKGTYFLVNRATRNVIWSVYAKPATTRPKDLNRTARDVAGELAGAIHKQAKGQK
jgi:hypothetical protein